MPKSSAGRHPCEGALSFTHRPSISTGALLCWVATSLIAELTPFSGAVLMAQAATTLPLFHTYVRDLEISPDFAYDRTVFAVLDRQGIFVSTDGGDHWTAINNGLASLDISDLAVSPDYATDRTLFAVTRNLTANEHAFLLSSVDGGQSWVTRSSFGVLDAEVKVPPTFTSDRTVFLFDSNGGSIRISTDAGATWPIYVSLEAVITDVAFSPDYAADGTLFAATRATTSDGGLFRSRDRGRTWSRITRQLVCSWDWDESLEAMSVSPNYATDRTIFAAHVEGLHYGTLGIWRTTDDGATWEYLM
jgi:photosystem II stability/assembly factor-like uncharacterized protein